MEKIKLFSVMIVIIVICTFFLKLPIYAPFIIILIVVPAVYFKSTISIIGNLLFMKGKEEDSRKLLQRAVALNTKSPAAYLNYAVMLMRDGNEHAELALEYLKKSDSLNSRPMLGKSINLAMGSCYWILGDLDKAIDVLEGMRKKYDYVNARVLTTLGYMYFLKEDYDAAMEISEKAIEDSPDSAAAWDNVGQIYFKQNDIKKAKEAFEKAVGFKDDMPDSLYYLGVIAEIENDMTLAREYFERAKKCNITGLSTITRKMVEDKLNPN